MKTCKVQEEPRGVSAYRQNCL